jgi:hypothetical protein
MEYYRTRGYNAMPSVSFETINHEEFQKSRRNEELPTQDFVVT